MACPMPSSANENIDNKDVKSPFSPRQPSPRILIKSVLDRKLISNEIMRNAIPEVILLIELFSRDSFMYCPKKCCKNLFPQTLF